MKPLTGDKLYTSTNPGKLGFSTTAELVDGKSILGQDRAVAAIEFAIGMTHRGYNLYALGPNGTGKNTIVQRFLRDRASREPSPDDWCYVHNFHAPDKPAAIRLPAGEGPVFRENMREFVDAIGTVLRAAFSAEEYKQQRHLIEEETRVVQAEAFDELRREAREKGIAFLQTPGGFAFAPLNEDGEVIAPDVYVKYSAEHQKQVEEEVQRLQERLQGILRQVPHWYADMQRHIRELDESVARMAIEPLHEELKARYKEMPVIVNYLEAVREDVIEHVTTFLGSSDESGGASEVVLGLSEAASPASQTRYRVNVIVENKQDEGAPVVILDQPRYGNLVGRVEHVSRMGALVTDFTLIKPGALHTANGGYLVLDARRLLSEPFAWEALKNALRREEIVIESPAQIYATISTVTLEPEPIPLDVKVAIVGERHLYYLLASLDPEFSELFRVAADFADEMDREVRSEQALAQLVAEVSREEGLRPFDAASVARVVEHGSRLSGDSRKLTTHMETVCDLLRQADYWAGQSQRDTVTATDVAKALEESRFRLARVPERIRESMIDRQILVATEGEATGQINALSVFQLGSEAFGRPSRITARVRLGDGQIIDIERQTEMGGPLHSKGVMILAGYLGGRYAAEMPLSLRATLVFEQSYGDVDGDSASCAELFALLSAIGEMPLRQDLAVTGSLNQHGDVQVIGGVNEKIEGFYDLCAARGLTGSQGVIIPVANVPNLMLRSDVVEAAEKGAFSIYAISHVDEGLSLLTGLPAGEPDEAGDYPDDTVAGRVTTRLRRFLARRREYGGSMSGNGSTGTNDA